MDDHKFSLRRFFVSSSNYCACPNKKSSMLSKLATSKLCSNKAYSLSAFDSYPASAVSTCSPPS